MMTSADKPPKPVNNRPKQHLRNKIFIPFVIIIILLGVAIISGTHHLVHGSFTQGSDERLNAAKEILYREFKKQEIVLQTYAVFVEHFENLATRFDDTDEVGILQDRLFNTLEKSNISVSFYPANAGNNFPIKSLQDLFEQVLRSGQVRFRYTNELGGLPVLLAAAPLREGHDITRIMLLYTEMGENFLHKVVDPINVRASLNTLDNEILARSHDETTPIVLSPSQMTTVGTGQPLFVEHEGTHGPERHLFTAIPLGSTDLVFLSLETSIQSTREVHFSMISRMLMALGGCLLLGAIIYFRIAQNLARPVGYLLDATNAVKQGNLNHRIHLISNDAFGDVSHSFNEMVEQLDLVIEQRKDEEIEKVLEQENAKTTSLLAKKDLDHKRLSDEMKTVQRELSALYQLNQAMTSSIELNILFDRILQVMNEVLVCDHIVLLVYNMGDSVLEVVRAAGLDNDILSNVKFGFDQGITGEAAQSQKAIYVKDVDQDERNLSYHGQIATRGSLVSTPLIVKGRLVGVLNLHKKQVDAFSASELKLIQAVSNQTAIAIDNTQLLERARDLSNTDELTGLANRRHFQEILKREVAQARRFNSVFSIIMCDIDHLKDYNEKHGRMHGDALLRQAGQLLLKSTRGIDLVCRFGNEEFVILLPKTNKQGGYKAAEKLRKAIEQETFKASVNAQDVGSVTMSFGVTEFPGDSKNIYELLNLADRALYAAKNDGRNCTVVWEGPAPGPD